MTLQNQITKSSIHLPMVSRRGILESTTDLAAVSGRKVLILLDEQNLSIGARNHGCMLDYGLLAERIHSAASQADLHVFTAVDLHDGRKKMQFEKIGYRVHVKTIWYTAMNRNSNIDNLFAFWTGVYSLRTSWDVIVFGSGDYGLSGELSQVVRSQRRRRQIGIMTLSLPGSTSQYLDAQKNQDITANLEIGLDLLRPLCPSTHLFPARAPGGFRAFRSNNSINSVS